MRKDDLVRHKESGRIGFVESVDSDFYGKERKALFPSPKTDRISVMWTDGNDMSYFFADELEVL